MDDTFLLIRLLVLSLANEIDDDDSLLLAASGELGDEVSPADADDGLFGLLFYSEKKEFEIGS